MNYKKKYLKYKIKYLETKKFLKGGGPNFSCPEGPRNNKQEWELYKEKCCAEEEAEEAEEEEEAEEVKEAEEAEEAEEVEEAEEAEEPEEAEQILINIITDYETKVYVLPTENVHKAIARTFERKLKHINEVFLGNDEVLGDVSFMEFGIEDGARLNVCFRDNATVEEVVTEITVLNPHLTQEELISDVEFDPEDASRIKGIYWGGKNIKVLPESIGFLIVDGPLNLSLNNLETLPESFGDLKVKGSVHLYDNPIAKLKKKFNRPNFFYNFEDFIKKSFPS